MKPFKEMKLGFELDPWQKEVLKTKGNICLCNGRQTGKSQVIAIKASEYAVEHPRNNIMIISTTEDQAMLLLSKIMLYLTDNYKPMIARGKNKPTRHKVTLTNGSTIITKAVGATGVGIRGHTIHVLVGDEAAYIDDMIWEAATPMLLTTGGQIWLLSTPKVMKGYFWRAYTDRSMGFQTFHYSSMEVAELRPEPHRSIMLKQLEIERARMTKNAFAQQYEAQFLEELGQFFPDSLIKQCQTASRTISTSSSTYSASVNVLGVDIARMGGDETTYEVFAKKGNSLVQIDNIVETKVKLTHIVDSILSLDSRFNFSKIYIDDAGLGAGVYDQLLNHAQVSRKVIGLNNARKSITRDDKRKRKLLKEDLYINLKLLMEQKRIRLLKDESVYQSLRSIIYDADTGKIFGTYSHIAEGIIRAAWILQGKHLKLWVDYI